jgi:phage tail-like protein
MQKLFRTVQGNGGVSNALEDFRWDLEIQVLSHPLPGLGSNPSNAVARGVPKDHTAMRFNVYNAWITSLAYSDLNAGDNAILVEQMSLVHEGFDLHWAPNLSTPAPAFS